MLNAVRELKTRAEILHKKIQRGDGLALERMRALPRFRAARDETLLAAGRKLKRGDCLSVIAAEWGFSCWPEAKRALEGKMNAQEFGSLLCPTRCGSHINRWYKRYDEAARVRKACQGYLLGFKKQYLVVDRPYIVTLGLDPDDADWAAIGYDWARPCSLPARTRLYNRVTRLLPNSET